jgi:hypothetical protein
MQLIRNITAAAATALLVTLAGCATGSGASNSPASTALADSAATLYRNAQALADHSDAMTPDLQQDAHHLAESTLQFRTAVGNGSDVASARTAFESVTQNYQRVQADVHQVDTAAARADLRPVTEAYEYVERALKTSS